jgi:hypothetical protein
MSAAGKKLIKAAKQARGLARERLQDSLDGVTIELAHALGVLWRSGNPDSRRWIFMNFPGWAWNAAIHNRLDGFDPYVKFDNPPIPHPPSRKKARAA